ncbi:MULTISPECIES: beta-N-acetylglucosaminidase domain-containing protein [Clostridium]|uniref:beta-N-acetylglucosaminidase domain-containing protein n=1 Tax=Clostridium TaxID=1485 RepID=UPI0022E27BAB|nr:MULTISPECIES: beta-N-acetylglucosaminidase domain-containing protein [Clostridium]MDB1944798.1 beta-N-acetylglucosaminidase domain-containing protein [Clostridium tertium]MDB1952021.1 beta-N-acetylglucosaminidase domain-containing protein [Clostridium tertium]MDB1968914.1 beta-N-acetylglucosaminidase domain-containing protein [Clostridium tertium]MDU1277528.1 beta-N-acetylglucosaminidase domain-containing protein [Clostridium sp.]MDU1567254.1 beta-N-acetylglucosaminidase domain-containing p
MLKAKLNSILAKVVVASFIFTTTPTTVFADMLNDQGKQIVKLKVEAPRVSPTPQLLESSGEGVVLSNKVNIIGQDKADKDAVRELMEFLKKLGLEVNNEFSDESTTIIIGEDDDNIEEMNKFLSEINKEGAESISVNEGYVLAANPNKNGAMTIAIEGTDEVGTYYGVKTLKELVLKENNQNVMPEVYVNDYPTQHVRAIVEGFYGNPWTHQDRLDQFRFYGDNKLNMYIYAPKDDPYHRDKWRDPYPQEEMARMQELINTAAENKVDFVFAISPGKDIDINSEADYQALVDKCESLYNMGVRSFSILWDDIFTDDGAGQAAIMNRFNKEFVKAKGDVKPLITVPTQYWGTSMFTDGQVKPYTKGFAENLDTDIEVMWTGENVMSETVTLDDAEKVNNLYNRKMLLWWNYPVSDYRVDKLALGPIYNLGNDLDSKIGGFIMNPMEFAEASKITLHTGADYAWNTAAYNHDKAWDNAISDLVGEELKESFKKFADHSTRLDTGREDAPEMRAIMDSFWNKVDNKQIPATELESLKVGFESIKSAVSETQSKLYSEMLEEVAPQLEKLTNYADAASTAADMVIAMLKGDSKLWWELKSKLSLQIEVLDSSKAIISEKVLDDFIKQANTKTDNMYFDGVLKEEVKTYNYQATTSDNLSPLKFEEWYNGKSPYELSNMFDGKLDTAYRSSGNIKSGDEIIVDLGQEEYIKNIYMLMGRTSEDNMIMNGNLQISKDGIEWKTIVEGNTFREVFEDEINENARYIKYVATEDQENQLYVREIMVNKNTHSGVNSSVDAKLSYKKSIADKNEINSVVLEEKVKLKTGDTIELELPEFKFITGVNVNSNANGSIEYTVNGIDWIKLGDSETIKLDKAQVVKAVRFVSNEDKTLKNFSMDVVIEGRGNQSVETNRNGSGNYKDLNAIIDGDLDSSFISSGALNVGDYFTLDLGEVTNVRNIQFIGDRAYGGDRIRDGKVEYSLDGTNWTEIYNGGISEQFRMYDLDFNAKYVRVTATKGTDAWLRMSDFSVNSPEAEVIFESTAKPSDDNHRLPNLMDNNIQTSYIPSRDLGSEDKLVYNIFDGALVNKVEVFQSEKTISNAKVIARTSDDRRIELGTLDKGYNMFNMEKPEEVISITLEFQEGSGKPEIYEIVTENFSLEAIKEIAKANLVTAKELLTNTEGKSNEVIEALKVAVTEVETLLIDGGSREEIFLANKKLESAIKDFTDYTEESKPNEKPEVKPEEKPENGGGDTSNGTEEDKNNKPGKLPQTGGPSGLSTMLLGITSLLGGVAVYKRRRK